MWRATVLTIFPEMFPGPLALSLAGIALIRSADTATVVSGNLAFKQAAVTLLGNVVAHGSRAIDWETSFRFAAVLSVILSAIEARRWQGK